METQATLAAADGGGGVGHAGLGLLGGRARLIKDGLAAVEVGLRHRVAFEQALAARQLDRRQRQPRLGRRQICLRLIQRRLARINAAGCLVQPAAGLHQRRLRRLRRHRELGVCRQLLGAGRGEVGFGELEAGGEVGGVELDQDVAGFDHLSVFDEDPKHLSGGACSDGGDVGFDEGVVGAFFASVHDADNGEGHGGAANEGSGDKGRPLALFGGGHHGKWGDSRV